MTTEEKAKAYDKAIERVRELLSCCIDDRDRRTKVYRVEDIESIFPELKEPKKSEDERIRKMLIKFFGNGAFCDSYTNGISDKDIVAWLEKQGEQKPTNKVEPKDYNSIDPHFGKPAGKVEPKFKVGDWVVKGNVIAQILDIQEQYYVGLDIDGNDFTSSRFLSDDKIHLWDITKDARDGDVLVSRSPFIYGKQCPYGGLNWYDNKFIKASNFIFTDSPVHPATKEQRDTLFKAMADAGYEFDFEKKELKKIENEIEIPFGAEDSELQEVSYYIPEGFYAEIDDDGVIIKKGKKPAAWSKEDDEMFDAIIADIRFTQNAHNNGINQIFYEKEIDWLKSLKQRYTWKPSDEQMDAFEHFVRSIGESDYAFCYDNNTKLTYSLLEQLKQL